MTRYHTGNWTTCEEDKHDRGIRCPHCGKWFCCFAHMDPRILVSNDHYECLNTGLTNADVYQICHAYLNTIVECYEDKYSRFYGERTSYQNFVEKEIMNHITPALETKLKNLDFDFIRHPVIPDFCSECFNDNPNIQHGLLSIPYVFCGCHYCLM